MAHILHTHDAHDAHAEDVIRPHIARALVHEVLALRALDRYADREPLRRSIRQRMDALGLNAEQRRAILALMRG